MKRPPGARRTNKKKFELIYPNAKWLMEFSIYLPSVQDGQIYLISNLFLLIRTEAGGGRWATGGPSKKAKE
jgi:hypothetical protein